MYFNMSVLILLSYIFFCNLIGIGFLVLFVSCMSLDNIYCFWYMYLFLFFWNGYVLEFIRLDDSKFFTGNNIFEIF